MCKIIGGLLNSIEYQTMTVLQQKRAIFNLCYNCSSDCSLKGV